MEVITDSHVLAEIYTDVRELTKFYLDRIENIDVHENYTANGRTLNNVYWIVGHLVWTEHYLLVEGLGGKSMDIPWLEDFRFGARNTHPEQWPTYQEMLAEMDRVHQEAMHLITSLSNDELEQANEINMYFDGQNTKRKLIYHAIRHEPTHAGQLNWILKMNGISTI